MSAIPGTTERHRLPAPAAPPAAVRTAYGLWLAAVAAGAFETVLAVGRMAADGGSVADALARAGALDLAFGASRGVHVAAVLVAVALMFRPAANAYFRRTAR